MKISGLIIFVCSMLFSSQAVYSQNIPEIEDDVPFTLNEGMQMADLFHIVEVGLVKTYRRRAREL